MIQVCGIDRHVPGSGYVLRKADISTREEGEFLKEVPGATRNKQVSF